MVLEYGCVATVGTIMFFAERDESKPKPGIWVPHI